MHRLVIGLALFVPYVSCFPLTSLFSRFRRLSRQTVLHAQEEPREIFQAQAPSIPKDLVSPSSGSSFGESLKHNWFTGNLVVTMNFGKIAKFNSKKPKKTKHMYFLQAGVCKHVNIFEGTSEVRRIRFAGDNLALGLIDGRCSVINMKTGKLIVWQHFMLPGEDTPNFTSMI